MVCFSLKGDKNGWAQEVLGAFRKVLCFYGKQKANAKFSDNKKNLKDTPPPNLFFLRLKLRLFYSDV